ncbi:hypothetical protein U91I_01602 [alpha proteobacterium U9-1i]|nr:hypothetical protein U91I_01602 [alpha proteobacterium U9-1i]
MTSQRWIGIALIVFAIGFNAPYAWLAINFQYPEILRQPPGDVLAAFSAGGAPLILAWLGFTIAALLLAPVALGVASITRDPETGARANGVAALGIAAAVTQAIGLSRWVYAVPGIAAAWAANPDQHASIEALFNALHQFAGVGIGEAIGQTLTAFWMIGVGWTQLRHPTFGIVSATLAWIGAAFLLLGLTEGLATVIAFDPGVLAMGAVIGFLVLTLWMIWTGVRALTARG